MDRVEITKAKNGWVVWRDGRDRTAIQEPIVFTDWARLSLYLRKQLAPEMKDVE